MNIDFIQIGANIGNEEDFIGVKLKNKEISSGIFIEPNPKSFKILNEKFKDNDQFFLEELAISNFCGKILLNIENYEDEQHCSHIASTIENFTQTHPWSNGFSITQVEVNCETLENLWNRYKLTHVKYLCVDTEGSDYQILINTDFSRINIDTIQFEHMHTDGVHATGENYENLKKHLINFGYKNIVINSGDTIVTKK